MGASTAGRIKEYGASYRQSCAHAISSCSSLLPGSGISLRGARITSRILQDAAQQLITGGIRLFLGGYMPGEGGGYVGDDQTITLRMVGPGAATTLAEVKGLLTHEAVHAAHHMAGRQMDNFTDEGLAHAVEALVRQHFNLPLAPLYRAALALVTGGGLGDPVEELDRELQAAGYHNNPKGYHLKPFRKQ